MERACKKNTLFIFLFFQLLLVLILLSSSATFYPPSYDRCQTQCQRMIEDFKIQKYGEKEFIEQVDLIPKDAIQFPNPDQGYHTGIYTKTEIIKMPSRPFVPKKPTPPQNDLDVLPLTDQMPKILPIHSPLKNMISSPTPDTPSDLPTPKSPPIPEQSKNPTERVFKKHSSLLSIPPMIGGISKASTQTFTLQNQDPMVISHPSDVEEIVSAPFHDQVKIAFMFIIHDVINHEEIWKFFFDAAPSDKYSIYIHCGVDVCNLQHFQKYVVDEVRNFL
jgi:hypothetical protein